MGKMAIPKVCGIENEYGFIVLDASGKQLPDEDYSKAARLFVGGYLKRIRAMRHELSKERRSGLAIGGIGSEAESAGERKHRLEIAGLTGESDGFLENGARFYLDCTHPEYSTPECLSPLDLVKHDKTSELVVAEAINLFLGQPANNCYRLLVHKNNSDGFGNSYGSHLNVLLPRDLVSSRPNFYYLLRRYLPFQIVRIILTGGGKIGAENKRPQCRFQISQRADFFERLVGAGTVERRPIFNIRDEPHADSKKYFRLHDISCDSLMCEEAIFFKTALTQAILAMIEDNFLKKELVPQNPIEALTIVSRDFRFKEKILLETGQKLTGMEILRNYLLSAQAYLSERPMAPEHLAAVNSALSLLEDLEKDLWSGFGRLDWVTGWGIMESRPGQAKANLLKFREISPDNLYQALLKKNKIKRLLKDEEIFWAQSNAPADTRAYLRGELIKRFSDKISELSWSQFGVRQGAGNRIFLMEPALDKSQADMVLSLLESK